MPTIDELAPATAATDSDELPVSQNLITRKITRAQMLAGLQPQITLPAGTILGRTTAGVGSPETVTIGLNLTLASGTLSAMATPYSIALSPSGLVPSTDDRVSLAQAGKNVSVSYSTFLQGLSSLATVDGSRLLVTPTGSTVGVRLADFASTAITKTGGTLSGPLGLASDPTAPLQAATRQYADQRVNRAGDTMAGPLQLLNDPTAPLQAATKSYVDSNANLLHLGLTMLGPIVLAADPIAPLNPATKSYADTRLLRGGDTMTGPLGLSAGPVSPLQAATKTYVDAQVATSLPLGGGSLNGPLTLSADPINLLQAATKQYTDARLARAGDTLAGPLTLAGTPTSPFHAASKTYVDSQLIAALGKSGGTMTGPIYLSGDPTVPSQAATKYYVDTGVAGAMPIAGGTVNGPIAFAATLAAAVVRLTPGQTIAFEATNSVNLSYSSTVGAIVAKYGATTCAIGRGISVSFGIIFSTSATIPATSAGCVVFLAGTAAYTITLPLANTMMAGTGFTFSAIGTGTVTISPASGDTVELAPITLRQYDRYHIISDGSSLWREIFRTNSVSPRFTGPPVLPSYLVTALPTTFGPGAKAYATNGRKPNEAAGLGTGVEVFHDATQWVSTCSGLPVTA